MSPLSPFVKPTDFKKSFASFSEVLLLLCLGDLSSMACFITLLTVLLYEKAKLLDNAKNIT